MVFIYSPIAALTLIHISILCLSNVLVQYPFTLLGLSTTWGALTYPLIFIFTDLTIRLKGQQQARKIIFFAMLPGLLSSYFISAYSACGHCWVYHVLSFRIALASFGAYFLGQLLDIAIFQRLRQSPNWWVAPSVSNIFGNLLDTYFFFFIAFYKSSSPYLNAHWFEVAAVDLGFKILISLISFVPLYGLLLNWALEKKLLLLFKRNDLIKIIISLKPFL